MDKFSVEGRVFPVAAQKSSCGHSKKKKKKLNSASGPTAIGTHRWALDSRRQLVFQACHAYAHLNARLISELFRLDV